MKKIQYTTNNPAASTDYLAGDNTWKTIPGGGGGSSPLTTKGDLFTHNASADARLPVGLNTQVLLADSSTATGLRWGSNTTPTPSGYYAQYQDVVTQTIAAINTGYPIKFRTMDLSNGVSVVSDSRITFANTGIYNLQFSVQLENSATQEHDITIWIRKNGVDVAGSAGFVSVVAKHGGVNGHTITSWNYLIDVVAGEYYELVWSATSTSITMPFYSAGSPPPSTASAIFTVTQQSGIMAGTGITAINSLTGAAQTMVTGSAGTDFAISSSGTAHTFNIPTASATNRGLLSSANWSTFNGKQDAITGAATTITSSNLTASRALISDGSGKVATNAVTSTELGYLSGVTSAIQTQISGKQNTITGAASTVVSSNLSNGIVVVSDGGGKIASSGIFSYELGYLSGATSNIQTQLNAKIGSAKSFMGTLQGSTLAGGATQYGSFNYNPLNATELARIFVVPYACTASNFYIRIFTSQPANGSFVFTLRKNQADTAVVATIAAGSAANTEANSGASTATYAAGDDMSFSAKNNATTTSGNIHNTSIMIEI